MQRLTERPAVRSACTFPILVFSTTCLTVSSGPKALRRSPVHDAPTFMVQPDRLKEGSLHLVTPALPSGPRNLAAKSNLLAKSKLRVSQQFLGQVAQLKPPTCTDFLPLMMTFSYLKPTSTPKALPPR